MNSKYIDLDLNFTRNPVSNDILLRKDENAINFSLKNLILTRNYERPFHSEIGTQINSILFDNITHSSTNKLRKSIEYVINNYEPRIIVLDISVVPSVANNLYYITIEYRIINTNQSSTFNLLLERTR